MGKTFIILLFFFKLAGISYGKPNGGCSCQVILDNIINDIENKYPGFQTKTSKDTAGYIEVRKQAITNAAKVTDREACFYVIEKYIRFFKDNHIIFTDHKAEPMQHISNGVGSFATDNGASLSGIWKNEQNRITIKIVKQPGKDGIQVHRAYVDQSAGSALKRGNAYFDLIGNEKEFYIRKYNSALTTFLLRGRMLKDYLIEPNGIWIREGPETINNKSIKPEYAINDQFLYRAINSKVYYIGIPAFNIQPKDFDSLVMHKIIPEIIANKMDHLIIDLRNNSGGNSSFLSLLRIIYEKPFSIPGDFVFSTQDMIERYRQSSNPAYQKMLPKLIANPGRFVQKDSLKLALKDVYPYPKRVSILVNENCASSTEYFLVLARHSSKVKIYGRHTSGTQDYSELLGPEKLPCDGYTYMRPTTKSFWTDTQPIDNKGIIPDVDLSAHPDFEWVDILKNIKLNNIRRY